jgi:cell division ATPase FtsA
MSIFQENVVIVDRGSYELRALLVRRGMGTFDILKKEILPALPAPEGDLEMSSYNLLRFIQTLFPEESVFYIPVNPGELFSRNVDLPTGDEKLAAEILAGDLEPLLPAALEDVEIVSTCWMRSNEQSRMTAFAVEKRQIELLADPVVKSGKSIGYMGPVPHLLASAIHLLPPQETSGRIIAQLDIGLYESLFNLLYDGRLAFTRVLPAGGASFTEEIAVQLGISFEEAEIFKRSSMIDLARKDADELPASYSGTVQITPAKLRRLKEGLLRIVRELAAEIERSILASPIREPASMYVSGGGSLLGGIIDVLEEETNLRCRRYPLLLGEEGVEKWIICLGMLQAAQAKKSLDILQTPTGARLRRGEFRWKPFMMPAIMSAAALLILLFSFIIGIVTEQRQLSALQGQMQEIAKSIPGINPKQDPVKAARTICQNRLRVMRTVLGGYRTLDILKEVTDHTANPAEIPTRLKSIKYDESAVELDLELDNVNQIVAVQEQYQRSRLFSAVEVGRPDVTPGRKVRLKLKLILKPVTTNLEVSCR